MKKLAMLFLATLTLVLSAAPRTPEQEVRAVLDEWLDALEHGDLARLERIIAPDYRITASAEARVMDRTQDLAPIASGNLKFESAEVSEVDVRVFGNTAVVTGVGKFSVVMKGKPFTVEERFTDVYVKRKGRWQPVASHSTPLNRPKTP